MNATTMEVALRFTLHCNERTPIEQRAQENILNQEREIWGQLQNDQRNFFTVQFRVTKAARLR